MYSLRQWWDLLLLFAMFIFQIKLSIGWLLRRMLRILPERCLLTLIFILLLMVIIQNWISRSDIKKLNCIAESQPHAAYSAYCHGLSFKWNYFF